MNWILLCRKAQSIVTLIEQGPATFAPIEFRIYGPSLERLSDLGDEARRLLSTIPGVTHVRTSLDPGGPQLAVNVRQHDAESAGVSLPRSLRNGPGKSVLGCAAYKATISQGRE